MTTTTTAPPAIPPEKDWRSMSRKTFKVELESFIRESEKAARTRQHAAARARTYKQFGIKTNV